jgi:hypothetical protein
VAPIFTLWTRCPSPALAGLHHRRPERLGPTRWSSSLARKAACRTCPSASMTTPGGWCTPCTRTFTACTRCSCPRRHLQRADAQRHVGQRVLYLWQRSRAAGRPQRPTTTRYRSIGTSFEIYPGVIVPSDLAPTQNGALIWNPGSQREPTGGLQAGGHDAADLCRGQALRPRTRATSPSTAWALATIPGNTRGRVAGQPGWRSSAGATGEIVAFVSAQRPAGPHQLHIVAGNGQTTVNGLTFHVLGQRATTPPPSLYEVGPGKTVRSDRRMTYDDRRPWADPGRHRRCRAGRR